MTDLMPECIEELFGYLMDQEEWTDLMPECIEELFGYLMDQEEWTEKYLVKIFG